MIPLEAIFTTFVTTTATDAASRPVATTVAEVPLVYAPKAVVIAAESPVVVLITGPPANVNTPFASELNESIPALLFNNTIDSRPPAVTPLVS